MTRPRAVKRMMLPVTALQSMQAEHRSALLMLGLFLNEANWLRKLLVKAVLGISNSPDGQANWDVASLITFSNAGESEEQVSLMSFCAGIVVGLSFMGQPYGICVPAGTTSQQATSIVVQYIDGQPARIHEDFNPFAVEALRAHWPCSLAADAREPLPVALR